MTPPRDLSVRHLDSQELIRRARDGDPGARDELASRYRPVLGRFAQSRLPGHARGRFDTEDLVQEAFLRALERLRSFAPRRRGAFLAYLRQIVMNMIRDELRAAANRPDRVEAGEEIADPGPGPPETLFDRETLDHYERALASLGPAQQEAVILRLEMDCDYDEIARLTGRRSANAARMFVIRAVERLAGAMSRFRDR